MSELASKLQKEVNDLIALDSTGRVKHLYEKFKEFGFEEAPASCYYHNCFTSGLLVHSLNVVHTALKLNDAFNLNLDKGSIVLCGLFHDANKLGIISFDPKTQAVQHIPRYVSNDKFDPEKPISSKNGPYKYNTVAKLHEGSLSAIYCAYYVPLAFDEMVAINTHDGPFVSGNDGGFLHNKGHLSVIIELADRFSGDILESDQPHLSLTRPS